MQLPPPAFPAGAWRMGAPDGLCFQYKGNDRAMSHIFLLNNPHFQKEFQKMMARRQTLFSFSLHFAPILSKLSVDNMPKKRRDPPTENHCVRPPFPVKRSKTAQDAVSVFVHYATSPSQSDNKTQVFVHFPRMITAHSFRHVPQPSVKISTIADEERNPATSGRSPADHSRVCRTYLRNSALRQTCRKPDLDPFQ